MRGKAYQFSLFLTILRITPACAGKRFYTVLRHCKVQDHPRVCGEKDALLSDLLLPVGSPPRVRGKVGPGDFFIIVNRITPACAGKRQKGGVGCVCVGDHPRVCGEKTKKSP